MDCPKCRLDSLRRITTSLRRGTGHGSWTCRRCGGVWLYLEDLPGIAGQLPETPVTDPGDEEQDARGGLCPGGHGILIRARVELDQPFYLDRCFECGGIWFDSGEWQRLATHHLLDALPELWTEAWQDQQRARMERESYLSWARAAFGDELYARLVAIAADLQDHPRLDEALAFIRNESKQEEAG
jgi:Zn-finger nucleic acid-binding protein